jgi:hypothetical protein
MAADNDRESNGLPAAGLSLNLLYPQPYIAIISKRRIRRSSGHNKLDYSL